MNEKNKNAYLTTLSLLNERNINKETTYQSDSGELTGYLTNEAPFKYELNKMLKAGKVFDHIVLLCSDEVISKRVVVDEANGISKTTIEYFKEFINEYLKECMQQNYDCLKNIISNDGNFYGYVEDVVEIVPISNNPNKKEDWGEIFDRLHKTQKSNYYIDFSGGSRASNVFVSLLLLVLKTKANCELKQIIYADINSGAGKIQDITSIYDFLSNYDIINHTKNHKDKIKAFSDIGISLSEKQQDRLIKTKSIKESTQKLRNDDEVQKKYNEALKEIENTNVNNIGDVLVQSDVKETKELTNSTAVEILLTGKEDIDNFIVTFREKLVDALLKDKLLVPSKGANSKKIKEYIQSVDNYYEKYDQKNELESGVVKFVLDQVNYLLEHQYEKPLESYKRITNILHKKYYPPHYSIKMSKEDSKVFMDYIYANDVRLPNEDELDIRDLFEGYYKKQFIYFSASFPFACVSGYGKRYDFVRLYYNYVVKKFFEDLESIQKKNKNEYIEKLKNLKNINVIRNEIPQIIFFENVEDEIKRKIKPRSFFSINKSVPEKYSNLVVELIKRIEEIRPCRNDIAHKIGIYSDEQKKQMADKIEKWLNEYLDIIKQI